MYSLLLIKCVGEAKYWKEVQISYHLYFMVLIGKTLPKKMSKGLNSRHSDPCFPNGTENLIILVRESHQNHFARHILLEVNRK